ncbi:hypothetical protein ACTMU2_08645 [Cupriavidus basilensis]
MSASANKATRRLFPIAHTPQQMLDLGEQGLEEYIKTIGLYKTKAKHVIQTCRILVEQHGGKVLLDRGSGHGGAAWRGPQDGQRGAEHRVRRVDHRGRHAYLRVGNRTGLAPGKTVQIVEDKLLKVAAPRVSA